MIDEETAELVANALLTQEISEMSAEELDELAIWHYSDDPTVEIDELGLSQDAGFELHGSNTEEEMLEGLED